MQEFEYQLMKWMTQKQRQRKIKCVAGVLCLPRVHGLVCVGGRGPIYATPNRVGKDNKQAMSDLWDNQEQAIRNNQ